MEWFDPKHGLCNWESDLGGFNLSYVMIALGIFCLGYEVVKATKLQTAAKDMVASITFNLIIFALPIPSPQLHGRTKVRMNERTNELETEGSRLDLPRSEA